MTLINLISRKASRLLPFVAAALLWSCSDEFERPDVPGFNDSEAQLVVTLAIPRGEQVPVASSRDDDDYDNVGPAVSDPTLTPTVDELTIRNLRLYLFPYEEPVQPAVINTNLYCPSADELQDEQKSVTYPVKGLERGKQYKMYLLANYGDAAADFANEAALRAFTTDYSSAPLKAGNLPMVYESAGPVTIPASDEAGPARLTAALQYACAKIRYSLIFDKTDPNSEFGSSLFLKPQSIALDNVTKTASAVYKTATSLYDDNTWTRTITSTGRAYTGFTVTETNELKNDDYIVNLTSDAALVTNFGTCSKWVYQGVVYVPERYVSDSKKQLAMKFNSTVLPLDQGSEHSHTIGLEAEDYKKINRGYCYEFIGRIRSLKTEGMVWTCQEHDWKNMTIDADFVHTFLTLSTTSAHVTTQEFGEIIYDTDGSGDVTFECGEDAIVDNTPLLDSYIKEVDGSKVLVIRPNADITFSDIPEGKRTNDTGVTCRVKAGNINKAISITYDLSPFLEITPTKRKIQLGEGVQGQAYTFEYRTNMGGFTLKSVNNSGWEIKVTAEDMSTTIKEHKIEESKFKVTFLPGSNKAKGTIELKDVTAAPTTTVHTFTATPAVTDDSVDPVTLTVEVSKVSNVYRIYFRAINDYQATNDYAFLHDNSNGLPDEFSGTGLDNSNWVDYWSWANNSRNNETANASMHHIYAYTQYGQNPGTEPVWLYTAGYGEKDTNKNPIPGFTYTDPDNSNAIIKDAEGNDMSEVSSAMHADKANPGWYYYDIPKRCNGKYLNENASGNAVKEKYGKGPVPGATLLIFYSFEDNGQSRHRVNQNNEPGIPLGDYADGESWVLFDPSRDPVYNVYDEKPIILNTTYKIYSDVAMSEWRNDYGTSNIHGTLKSKEDTVSGYQYCYTLDLKAPQGEYDKNITLLNVTISTGTLPAYPENDKDNYFFFGVPDGSDSKWNSPKYKVIGNKKVETDTYFTYTMEKVEKIDNIQYYRIRFNQTYHLTDSRNNGFLICDADDNKLTEIENLPSGSSPYVVIIGMNSNKPQALTTALGATITTGDYLMFGGNSWRTGYFKNGSWSRNP